jgi:hypothetical protein
MGRDLRFKTRLTSKENEMIDMTKIDFTKFDTKKFLDADVVLDNLEGHATTATGFITDSKVRDMINSVNSATFAFARAQIEAAKIYAESVKAIVEKQTKIAS